MKKNIKRYKKFIIDGNLENLRKILYEFICDEFVRAGGKDININSSWKIMHNVTISQRSKELLVLRNNLFAFANYKNGCFSSFALPLSWLESMGIKLSF